MNDAHIWISLKKGDQHAISWVYNEYSEKLYHFGFKFTSNTEIIEDSIHDLFIDLIKNRDNLGNTDNILFYLLKSFRRKLIRKIQKENRYATRKINQEYDFNITWPVENEIIEREAQEKNIRNYYLRLNRLTSRQKEAIYLRFTRELNYNKVAEIMNISVESCRNLISRALLILKQ
jgi:RNA polymerase sigma factor (sigma-70 family)